MLRCTYATESLQGFITGDSPSFERCFWEVNQFGDEWAYFKYGQKTAAFVGREQFILWENGTGAQLAESRRSGQRFKHLLRRRRMG